MDIVLEKASFTYPNGFLANEDINLVIREKERVGIIGQNGAGKTTAVKMMNGLHKPTAGNVLVGERSTKEYTTAQIARNVGYVFQNPDDQIFNQTVRSEIAYMPKYYKMSQRDIDEKVNKWAEILEITDYLDCNPYEIPYVTRKFVTIAAVMVTDPSFVILDEPTAGQDLRGVRVLEKLLHILQQEGVGVITITHDMEFVAQNFKRIIVMANKHVIADGTPKEIFSRDEVISESKITRTQIGEIANELCIAKDYLYVEDLAGYFIEREGKKL